MTILHITGKPRKGKGILQTFLTLPIADAGKPVDSNYHLYTAEHQPHPNVNFIGFYDLLSFLKKPRVTPEHLLNIDELPGWCDSYATQAKGSRFASHFVNQSQKLGYDMIFTSQRAKRADINYRELADLRMDATRVSLCGSKRCPEDCTHFNECYFQYQPMDMNNLEEDVPKGKPLKLPFSMAKTFWSRYDTYEAVPPVGLDEVLVEMQKYDPTRHNQIINEQVRAVREAWQPSYIMDRTTVKDIMLELYLPTVDVDVVFSRLRRTRQETQVQKKRTETPQVEAAPYQRDVTLKWLQLQKAKT